MIIFIVFPALLASSGIAEGVSSIDVHRKSVAAAVMWVGSHPQAYIMLNYLINTFLITYIYQQMTTKKKSDPP